MRVVIKAALVAVLIAAPNWAQAAEDSDTYNMEEILSKAEGFFGDVSDGLAKAVQKAFKDMGEPNAFITGEEVGGAFIVGIRYGRGELNRKTADPLPVFWQGPTAGFDFGGDASKAFVLIYNLDNDEALFQRFPGVAGSAYFVAGVGLNYQQSGKTVLAPIRTGVGLRLGANVGYLHYTRQHSWIPL